MSDCVIWIKDNLYVVESQTLKSTSILQFLKKTVGLSNSQVEKVMAVKINDVEFDLRDNLSSVVIESDISDCPDSSFVNSRKNPSEEIKMHLIDIESPDGLEILRHDTAHLLAHAIKEIYGEKAQITIGPNVENGFYYDVYLPFSIVEEDLAKIETKMHEICDRNLRIEKDVWKIDDAINFFKGQGEHFKAEIISDLAIGAVNGVVDDSADGVDSAVNGLANEKDITKKVKKCYEVSVYKQGDFVDLCRGPHGLTTGLPKSFKLTHVAGAYWRGNAKNVQLQRIYGICWRNENELNECLNRLQKVKEIDHRNLGRKLKLFHMQQESPGCVFWHERGWILYKIIEEYMREKIKSSYKEVHTPQMIDRKLWEMSGHWEHFKENMFCFESNKENNNESQKDCVKKDLKDSDKVSVNNLSTNEEDKDGHRNDAQSSDRNEFGSVFALKPMNCPAHTQIFKSSIRSYKELPLRFFEFGCCHRNEPSGSLHGIMRVKQFVQDDGHIFCREADIVSETQKFCEMLLSVYRDFGFYDVSVKFSTRPENRAGTNEIWDKAESLLMKGAELAGLKMQINEGEGAFYGPKLEFLVKDCVGRDWQCGTLQLDFVMPERLNVRYVNDHNEHVHPIMIHRAILGSLQRFIGILIEHYEGRFPLWLAPTQVAVVTLSQSDEIIEYAKNLQQDLNDMGLRTILDDRNERLEYKIQQLIGEDKIPCLCIVGNREAKEGSVSVRVMLKNKVMKKGELLKFLKKNMQKNQNIYEME